jgi:hypothetical protein
MSGSDHLSEAQFPVEHVGPWYHGAGRSDYTELDGPARYNMPDYLHGHTYVTQRLDLAEEYARTSHDKEVEDFYRENSGQVDLPEHIQPTVYTAEPDPGHAWSPDPHGGSSGWNDGPTEEEQTEVFEQGSNESEQVGLENPVKIRSRDVLEPDTRPYKRRR